MWERKRKIQQSSNEKPFIIREKWEIMREKFVQAMREKGSNLCIGLDPRPQHVQLDTIYEFCTDIVEKTSQHCFCYKPNTQYIMPMGFSEIEKLNEYIHDKGCLSILDHKLSDIGSTNESALYWLEKMGFDAFTYSPFPGNIKETVQNSRKHNIGVITLTLMSNLEAELFMKSKIQGKFAFEFIAEQIAEYDGFGAVVGATCKIEDIKEIYSILKDQLILSPGVGAQGGGLDIVRVFKERTIVNVSRDIITSDNPKKRAKYYRELINGVLQESQ